MQQPMQQQFCMRCDTPEETIRTDTNNKPKLRSTDYYRNNRINKTKMYKCSHENCNYTTYNSKSALINHINAKHVPESERPFQCKEPGCCRGFSQKAHLANHMKRQHNKDLFQLEGRTTDIIYNISLTNKVPRTKTTIARRDFI